MTRPVATVVVVARDRWTGTAERLQTLLGATDPRHPVVVVAGAVPTPVRNGITAVADRVENPVTVVEHRAFLPGNVARNLGARGAEGEWLAFVENDVVLDHGWLDTLLDRAEATAADVVYPAYLQPHADGPKVHGLGAELELRGPEGARHLIERQHHLGRRWADVAPHAEEAERVQSEPHCFVMRRSLHDELGGLDEQLLGWFDHTDLGLHVLERGARSRMVPAVTCLYVPPPPLARSDFRSFATRWGRPWYEASLARICDTWGLDPDGPGWAAHATYRFAVQTSVPTPWRRMNRVLARATAPRQHPPA